MISALDSSVVVAALVSGQPHHAACAAVLDRSELRIHAHAVVETYAFLTGGRLEPRVGAAMAAELIGKSLLPFVEVVSITAVETMKTLRECESRGIRGGAIYDYLHLVGARKARATRLFTLNIRHFQAFHRSGDPEIVHP